MLLLQQVYISSLTFSDQGLDLRLNAKHYRTELDHLRRGSLSIKDLNLEVRRLVSKAFPGEGQLPQKYTHRDMRSCHH